MKEIGFEDQPYLVYRHEDAAHPHIHIVSTNIRQDGSKIDMQNIGRNQSEKARKNIEQEYHLIKAAGRKLNLSNGLKIPARKIHYGKSPIKTAITNVLEEVINNYKYASLPELNAVLQLYNVVADRGNKDSKMYAEKGLMYSVLDEQGNKIGVPIKASAFYNKPTLKNLEQKFTENENLKNPFRKVLQTKIKWVLLKKEQTIQEFKQGLASEGIKLVARQSEEGNIYGLTYVDLKSKCVFNGSDLGKEFSASAVLHQLKLEVKLEQLIKEAQVKKKGITPNQVNTHFTKSEEQNLSTNKNTQLAKALHQLFKQEQKDNSVPFELLKKKPKRHKRSLSL